MKYIIPFFLCMFLWAGLPKECSGQVNLVDLKKKEEERRKKTEKSKKAVDDGNIDNAGNTGKSSGFVQVETLIDPSGSEETKATAEKDSKNRESQFINILDPKEEEKWRNQKSEFDRKIKELEASIEKDEGQIADLWRQHYGQTSNLEQNNIKAKISQLNTQLEGNKAKLDQLKVDRTKFMTEAKKKGVPPGWLR